MKTSSLTVLWATVIACLVMGCAGPGTTTTVAGLDTTGTTVDTSPPGRYYVALWGEQVTVEGFMRITMEAPQADPGATPASMPAQFGDPVVIYCLVTVENLEDEPLAYDSRDFEPIADEFRWPGGWRLTSS